MGYLGLFKISFKKNTTYRLSCVIDIIISIITIFIFYYFWKALYGKDVENFTYMINYSVIAQLVYGLFYMFSPSTLVDKIRTGNICIDLLRPWNILVSLLVEDLGAIAVRVFTTVIPVSLLFTFIFQLKMPKILPLIGLIIATFIAIIILYLIKMCVSMICFWITEAWSFSILLDVVILIFSGKFVPSWLMPESMEKVMNFLPFIWTCEKPVKIYLDCLNEDQFSFDSFSFLLSQLVWLAILILILCIIWKRALKKLAVQGG